MRGLITETTDIFGHRLVERLFDCGHTVVGFTRDEEDDDLVEFRRGTSKHGDVLEQGSLTARNYFGNPGRV